MKLIKFPKGNHLRKKQKKLSNRRRWDPPQEKVNGQDNYSPQNREIPALQCVNPFPPAKQGESSQLSLLLALCLAVYLFL
jgi:hypothetical protein